MMVREYVSDYIEAFKNEPKVFFIFYFLFFLISKQSDEKKKNFKTKKKRILIILFSCSFYLFITQDAAQMLLSLHVDFEYLHIVVEVVFLHLLISFFFFFFFSQFGCLMFLSFTKQNID